MKIDLNYMARLLNVFLSVDKSHINISILEANGIQVEAERLDKSFCGLDDYFAFHMQLAIENKLISNHRLESFDFESVGLQIYTSGGCNITDTPIRLTQRGHDFASALENKEVLENLKENLKNAPFKVIYETSQKLLEHVLKKKIDLLLE